jgi:hypothetical protein
MWAGHPDGFLQVNPVVLAEPEEIVSSRLILVVLGNLTVPPDKILRYLDATMVPTAEPTLTYTIKYLDI